MNELRIWSISCHDRIFLCVVEWFIQKKTVNDRQKRHQHFSLREGHLCKMPGLVGVAGCLLHPYQRWDLGCSCEQHIRIIILPQVMQQDLEMNGSALIEYTRCVFDFEKIDCSASFKR
jgi:hypothetical protein